MELVLALVGAAVVIVHARRGYLHPQDYLVAAGLALLLAVGLVPWIPTATRMREEVQIGAPRSERARAEFLRHHALLIEGGLILFAAGAGYAILARRRAAPDPPMLID
jgi:hypothetical protein